MSSLKIQSTVKPVKNYNINEISKNITVQLNKFYGIKKKYKQKYLLFK